ncbi:uncharacterized protein LOC109504063 [Harpegnathos saltator]|uniref:uncharacterized protein LOC109504063 n=1 Tax=Harpegnathos saltator TaxID=610380 RepID=UPI000948F624|nr:uncharacterized protein LOC109504063 [Harpegnathos saltator]
MLIVVSRCLALLMTCARCATIMRSLAEGRGQTSHDTTLLSSTDDASIPEEYLKKFRPSAVRHWQRKHAIRQPTVCLRPPAISHSRIVPCELHRRLQNPIQILFGYIRYRSRLAYSSMQEEILFAR